MKKSLLDILFASEKRKNVLLLLRDGPKEMPFILDSLATSRQALLPQMRILKEHDLLYQVKDSYELTTTGKMIVDEMTPFLGIIETLGSSSQYLEQHNIDAIPEHFLKRINEIRGFTLVEPEHVNSIELNTDFISDGLASKAVYLVYTFMHPTSFSVFDQLVANGVEVSVIVSRELAQKMINEIYAVSKHILGYDKVKIYIYEKDVEISSLSVTDNGFLLRLLSKNNEFSNKQVMCFSPEGRQWSKELWDHYLKDAKLLTEIEQISNF